MSIPLSNTEANLLDNTQRVPGFEPFTEDEFSATKTTHIQNQSNDNLLNTSLLRQQLSDEQFFWLIDLKKKANAAIKRVKIFYANKKAKEGKSRDPLKQKYDETNAIMIKYNKEAKSAIEKLRELF